MMIICFVNPTMQYSCTSDGHTQWSGDSIYLLLLLLYNIYHLYEGIHILTLNIIEVQGPFVVGLIPRE